jgi:GntR family uxuAB operon transcriptional repressor
MSADSRKPRLYTIVALRIRQLILDDGYAAGDRLPSERELAIRLNVSRTSIREALVALQIAGDLVVTASGRVHIGVITPPRSPAHHRTSDLSAARQMVAVEIAGLAAKAATGVGVDKMMEALFAFEHHLYPQPDLENDFFVAVAYATGNTALIGLTQYLWGQPAGGDIRKKDAGARHKLSAILTAIVGSSESKARQAVYAYLD